MNIHILGAHNCESQNSRFVSILIDDVLAIDAGGLTSSLSFNNQQNLKAILLTHHHYDHIRDIPALLINRFLEGGSINIYSTQLVYDVLTTCLLNNRLYPNFFEKPQNKPTAIFTPVKPYVVQQIEGYSILPVPVHHSEFTVGYQVTSPDGKSMFYTGDTGTGLADCWERVSPQLLVIEVTAPNKYEAGSKESGHLTPSFLQQELTTFQKIHGYLPKVVTVHMSPYLENEIEAELAEVARNLNHPIRLAYEGMRVQL